MKSDDPGGPWEDVGESDTEALTVTGQAAAYTGYFRIRPKSASGEVQNFGLWIIQIGSGDTVVPTAPSETFSVSQAPTDGVILVVRNGIALEKVAPSAGLMQYEISGANLTLGTAPQPTDDLWALLMTSGSGFSVENLGGTKDGVNKDFTVSVAPVENALLTFHQGVALTRVGNTPAIMEYATSGTDVTIGTPAPQSGDGLWAFLRTS